MYDIGNTLKIVGITAAISIVGTYFLINSFGSKELVRLEEQLKQLQTDNVNIKDSLKKNADQVTADNKIIATLTLTYTNSILENQKLKKQLDSIVKPPPTAPIKDVQDVEDRIASMYKDNTVKYVDNYFHINYPTTSSLVFDAQQWNTQGSYLQEKLQISTDLNKSFQQTIDDCNALGSAKDVKIEDLTKRDAIHVTLEGNLTDQTVNLTKQLKVEKKHGIFLVIKGVAIGISVAEIINLFIKKK